MTDNHETDRDPNHARSQPPQRPLRDPLRSPRRQNEEPYPRRAAPNSARQNRGEQSSQPQSPEPDGLGIDRERTYTNPRLTNPNVTAPNAEWQSNLPPRRVEERATGQYLSDQQPGRQQFGAPQSAVVPPVRPSQSTAATQGATSRPETAPSRIPFWAGFTLSFLLLTIVSLGILVFSTGIDRFDIASLQGTESGWVPPEIIPTPTADPAQAAEVVASGIAGGQYGLGATLRNVTSTNVRIRQSPGNLSKPDGDIVAGIPAGGQVEIIGGPASADGLTWWLVRYTTSSGQVVEGWSAEVTASGLRILGPTQ